MGKEYNRRVRGDEAEWSLVCDEIDRVARDMLVEGSVPFSMRVARDVPDSCEAWVHVTFALQHINDDASDGPLVNMRGVLTWQNCD